ncbi:hypothetical protein ACIQ9J_21980 [Streptomyces sp. NPDC094153]|uniref:hypothetical protein n=1 Tax=Streptomyces sp. NPDC094153 TaxID=3366058 RepID=UPI003828CE1A
MNIDLNALVSLVGTLGAVALGSWLTARATARANAKAERDTLGIQFDAMFLAVAELRAAVEADRVLWSNRWERARAALLAAMTGLGPAAFVRGSDQRQIAAILGGAGWFLAQERTQTKAATVSLVPKLAAVAAAAAPLLRHPSTDVQEATDRFMAAIFSYHESRDTTELEARAADFGSAVRAVLDPPPHRRLSRHRRRQQ